MLEKAGSGSHRRSPAGVKEIYLQEGGGKESVPGGTLMLTASTPAVQLVVVLQQAGGRSP